MKNHDTNLIYEKINPLIKKNLSNEQKIEIKRVLKLTVPEKTDKTISMNFNFWLFETFYITLYLSKEKRSERRRFKHNKIIEYLLIIIYSIFIFILIVFSFSAIFLALYYIKSLIGIDLFPFHLIE